MEAVKSQQDQEKPYEFKATELAISTCTIITNINGEIDLDYFSRFVPVYNQSHKDLELKSGGIYNIEYYGNLTRGEYSNDKIKDEFSNQATLKFKYWGFRHVNVKLFMNGKLQMTGLKSKDESELVSKLIIDIIRKVQITVIPMNTFIQNSAKMTHDFQLVIDTEKKRVYYYRSNYNKCLKLFTQNTTVPDTTDTTTTTVSTTTSTNSDDEDDVQDSKDVTQNSTLNVTPDPTPIQITINTEKPIYQPNNQITYNNSRYRRNRNVVTYVPEIIPLKPYLEHTSPEHITQLLANSWFSDAEVLKTLEKLEKIKEQFIKDYSNLLCNIKTLYELKNCLETIIDTYTDFRSTELDSIKSNIHKALTTPNNDEFIVEFKEQLHDLFKIYKTNFEKKINRYQIIRNTDVDICTTIEKYLNTLATTTTPDIYTNIPNLINMNDIIPFPNYFVSDIKIVLINSDYLVNTNFNLKKVSKLLKKLGYFNSYEPDDYPGVLTRFYYNTNNVKSGICNCLVHCSTKDKKSICTKITISIFRPGSIIITGARDVEQLKTAYNFIYKVISDNINLIRGVENDTEQKQVALLNNEFRKISRKPRLFYIKKSDIVNCPVNSSLFD